MLNNAFDRSRRKLVLGAASIAGLSTAGCCTLPPSQIAAGCTPRPEPFLAGPEVQAAWRDSARYFDAHTHFFNAQDVPVAGFLSKSVAHSISDERLRQFVIALAPIAEALGKTAITAKAEHETLCGRSLRDRQRLKSLTEDTSDLDTEIERQAEERARELYLEIIRRNSDIPRLFDEAAQRAKSSDIGALRNQVDRFSEELVVEAFRDGAGYRLPETSRLVPQTKGRMSSSEATALSMRGALQFVRFMLSPRHHNLRTYIRRYAEQSPGLPLSGCFASMVDFNYWLDCPDRATNLQDQVRLHEQLALLSGGFLMPLVAYNPWVDIKEDDASIKLVKKAVQEHGCVGVKMYPPMGFYPYGNARIPVNTAEQRPDSALLDRKLSALYQLCDELGVPVMAHAGESNGRDDAHDALASAVGWNELLDKGPALKRLTVNAGHFGGAQPREVDDWTNGFIKLMARPGGLRVYGDLGYWDELMDSTAAQAKLKRALATRLGAGESVADRVMYGSDWLMLSNVPGWELYAQAVGSLLKNFNPPEIADKVLGANAIACFGLAGGGVQLRRLVDFHVANGNAKGPGWLRDVGATGL